MKTGGFIKTNWVYFVWCAFYIAIATILLGCTLQSFLVTIVIYIISIAIALSPAGEFLLRYMEGVRRIATQQEHEYLDEVWEEVKQTAVEKNSKLSNVELFIIDTHNINAFALGRNTVAVTQGMINAATQEQLRGVLGHELGHIANGDTKALLLNVVGNGIFSIVIVIFRLMLLIVQVIANMSDKSGLSNLLVVFMSFCLTVAIFIFMQIGQIILALNSRRNEYLADEFSFRLGYGIEMVEVLYMLQKINVSGKMKLRDRLKASHPYLSDRIARLEQMLENEEE